MQTLGVKKRKAGQELGVDPVVLHVFGVVAAKVRALLGRDQVHERTARPEEGGGRHPGHAGRLHHHHEDVAMLHPFGGGFVQGLEVGSCQAEPTFAQHLAASVGEAGSAFRRDGQV